MKFIPIIETNSVLITDFYKTEANYGHLYTVEAHPPAAATIQMRGGGDGKQNQAEQHGRSTLHHEVPFLQSLAKTGCHTRY